MLEFRINKVKRARIHAVEEYARRMGRPESEDEVVNTREPEVADYQVEGYHQVHIG
jgi:hypothetical protein